MATLSISRRFAVDAPPQRVLAYLTTPALLVHCLPGAELTSSSDDGKTHEGTVTVKLGAISVSYRGTAVFEDVDTEARLVRIKAKAREKTGAGAAELSVVLEVAQQSAGVSEVALEASASVSGRIVTLGRGMIDIVSEQVLSDFVTCLCGMLATSTATESPEDAAAASASPSGGSGGSSGAPPLTGGTATPASTPAPVGQPAVKPASALGILWRALRSWVRRRFGGT